MLDKKVLIADHHPVARAGLEIAVYRALPSSTVECVGTLKEAEAAISRSGRFRLVICDPELPDAQGLSGLVRMQGKLPRIPIVLLVGRDDRTLVGIARSFGAAGVLQKSASLKQLCEDLRKILNGEAVFPPHSVATSTTMLRKKFDQLSPAQRRVLFAVSDGSANKRIAYDLAITEATVKAHMSAIFRQLNVTNRAQLMLKLRPIFGEDLSEI